MANLLIAIIASTALIVMAIFAKTPNYHVAPAFLVPVVWGVYLLRKKLYLQPVNYALFASAVLLHMSGAFGFYQKADWLPFSFDILVHYYFALVIVLILHHALEQNFSMRPWQVTVVSFFVMMGLGALHEIMEYMSYLLFHEQGMMHPDTMYFFDTQRDLTNNLLGTLTALCGITLKKRFGNKSDYQQRPDG